MDKAIIKKGPGGSKTLYVTIHNKNSKLFHFSKKRIVNSEVEYNKWCWIILSYKVYIFGHTLLCLL
jgi:hypothetical protein